MFQNRDDLKISQLLTSTQCIVIYMQLVFIFVYLFLCSYVVSTLNRLVVDNYIIVYFHSAAPRRSMPGFNWLRQFYQMVDRR